MTGLAFNGLTEFSGVTILSRFSAFSGLTTGVDSGTSHVAVHSHSGVSLVDPNDGVQQVLDTVEVLFDWVLFRRRCQMGHDTHISVIKLLLQPLHLKHNLRLKMLPYLFRPKINFSSSERDSLLREKLSVKEVSNREFERLLARLIPSFIPKCYLEDFRKLEKNALKTADAG